MATSNMLWVDKHRPKDLAKLDYHDALTKQLSTIAKSGNMPHMLFYGPSGAGKKTRIMALLKGIFGNAVYKLKLEQRSFKTPSKATVEITMLGSNHHIELNPADCGNKDTFVVQEVIKEIAQFGALDSQNGRGFKVVVLSEVDNLSKNAQAALRRTMEKYTSSCRLILCCERPSKVIDPVRSRCLGIRVAAPKQDQIVAVLQKVCKSERVQLPDELAVRIAAMSKRNLRRAVLMLEACKVQQYPMAPNQVVNVADWERFIGSIANDICTQQSPKSLLSVRSKLYELLTNCIPADLIIKELTRHIMRKCDDQLKIKIAKWSAFYEHRLHLGQKDILHLEAFCAKMMAVYKQYLMEQFSF